MILKGLQWTGRKHDRFSLLVKQWDLESRGPSLFDSLTGKHVVVAILGFVLQLQGTVLGLTRANHLQVLYGEETGGYTLWSQRSANKQSWVGILTGIPSCGLLVLSLLLTLTSSFYGKSTKCRRQCWKVMLNQENKRQTMLLHSLVSIKHNGQYAYAVKWWCGQPEPIRCQDFNNNSRSTEL